jgi:hypothetical protein
VSLNRKKALMKICIFKQVVIIILTLVMSRQFVRCRPANFRYESNIKAGFEKYSYRVSNDDSLANAAFINSLENYLELNSLSNGCKGFELRLYKFPFFANAQVLIFKHSGNNSMGMYYTFPLEGKNNYGLSHKYEKKEISPSGGWPSFFRQVLSNEIYLLKDYRENKNYPQYTDAVGIIAEFADEHQHRICSIMVPWATERDYPDSKKLMNVLRLIKKEFSIDYSK